MLKCCCGVCSGHGLRWLLTEILLGHWWLTIMGNERFRDILIARRKHIHPHTHTHIHIHTHQHTHHTHTPTHTHKHSHTLQGLVLEPPAELSQVCSRSCFRTDVCLNSTRHDRKT